MPNDWLWRRLAVGAVVLMVLTPVGWIALRAMGVSVPLPWDGPPQQPGPTTAAIAPEPERLGLKIKGSETYHIVRQIRCETRKSIISALILGLKSYTPDPAVQKLAEQYISKPSSIRTFSPNLIKDPALRAAMKRYYDAGVAYDFNRGLRQTDSFGDLITKVTFDYCYGYTSEGNDSIGKLLADFINLTLFDLIGRGGPLSGEVRDFMYTTDIGRTDKVTIVFAVSEKQAVMAIDQFKSRPAQ